MSRRGITISLDDGAPTTEDVGYCVYVIAHISEDRRANGPVKVGVTGNVSGRLDTLQTGNPRKLCYVMNLALDPADARRVEVAFHAKLSECRLAGEWFDMEPLTAVLKLYEVVRDELGLHLRGWDELVADTGNKGFFRSVILGLQSE